MLCNYRCVFPFSRFWDRCTRTMLLFHNYRRPPKFPTPWKSSDVEPNAVAVRPNRCHKIACRWKYFENSKPNHVAGIRSVLRRQYWGLIWTSCYLLDECSWCMLNAANEPYRSYWFNIISYLSQSRPNFSNGVKLKLNLS